MSDRHNIGRLLAAAGMALAVQFPGAATAPLPGAKAAMAQGAGAQGIAAQGNGAGGRADAEGAGGFAGLGTAVEGFATPRRDHVMAFPRNHGAHPDFRIEWWYFTANLTDAEGRDYGAQWTLFRSALAPEAEGTGWSLPQIWMAHAGLTTPQAHFAAERFARGGVGQADVVTEPFHAFLDDWEKRSEARPGEDQFDRLAISARGADFAFRLQAVAEGPLVLQGDGGFSLKSAGGMASHYYSQPFYRIEGWLHLPSGEEIAVTGQGWLDREWSSQPLEGEQTGWDWFAMHLDSGEKLMAAQLREGGVPGFQLGTWIAPDGTPDPQPDGAFRFTPLETARVAGRDVPVRWRIELPARGLDVTATAINPQSWMDTSFAYWEGPVRIEGTHPGRGYMELTGY